MRNPAQTAANANSRTRGGSDDPVGPRPPSGTMARGRTKPDPGAAGSDAASRAACGTTGLVGSAALGTARPEPAAGRPPTPMALLTADTAGAAAQPPPPADTRAGPAPTDRP